MKKKNMRLITFILVIISIILFASLEIFLSKGNIFSYGRKLTIEDITKEKELLIDSDSIDDCYFKRAMVNKLGATAHDTFTIYNKNKSKILGYVTNIGNRNLYKINNSIYICIRRDK